MLKVLALCGHLDDSIIAIGGILRKIVDEGGVASVVCFGNGSEGYANLSDKDTIVERFTEESKKAHKILGIANWECLNYTDFGVSANEETYKLCIQAIRKYQPDVIFSHFWAEYMQHRAMARLACDSWWQAGWRCSADLGKNWQARALYHFEVIHLLPEPTHIVDISDTFETKIKAWETFRSQQEMLNQMTEQLESRARFYGSLIGVKYGEALKKSSYIAQRICRASEL